jgi:hypothetical protein
MIFPRQCTFVSCLHCQGIIYVQLYRAALQVLFLNELEEVLELCRGEQLVQVQDNLFRLLAACLGSSHFQVRPKH